MRKRRGFRVSASDPPPEAYRALRGWLRFRWGKRGDFDRYLVQAAARRRQEAVHARQRSRTIAKGLAVVAVGFGALPALNLVRNETLSEDGLVFLVIAGVAAAVALWSWRATV